MTSKPISPRTRRTRWRLSIRALMVLVLLVGGGFGWVVYRARVQRDAAEAIVKAGGFVIYDWQGFDSPQPGMRTGPAVPSWLLNLTGPDFFQTVVAAGSDMRRSPDGVTDEIMPAIGQLSQIDHLWLQGKELTDNGLKSLQNLKQMR